MSSDCIRTGEKHLHSRFRRCFSAAVLSHSSNSQRRRYELAIVGRIGPGSVPRRILDDSFDGPIGRRCQIPPRRRRSASVSASGPAASPDLLSAYVCCPCAAVAPSSFSESAILARLLPSVLLLRPAPLSCLSRSRLFWLFSGLNGSALSRHRLALTVASWRRCCRSGY